MTTMRRRSLRDRLCVAALLAGLAVAVPHAAAEEIDLTLGGFVQLDHYGLVAEGRLYTNERVRLTAAVQMEAANAAGDLAAFAELYAFAQIGAHEAVPETAVERRFGEVTVIDPEFIVRQAYVTLRTDAFDIDVGQKFVHWGKVDLLSPLDVVNHTNTATLGLGDAFESPLADPMVHVTAYLDDAFSLELVYVPFLAPDLVGIDELEFDLTLGHLRHRRALRESASAPVLGVGALGPRGAVLHLVRGGRAGHLFVLPRSDAGLRPERDSGDEPHRGR